MGLEKILWLVISLKEFSQILDSIWLMLNLEKLLIFMGMIQSAHESKESNGWISVMTLM